MRLSSGSPDVISRRGGFSPLPLKIYTISENPVFYENFRETLEKVAACNECGRLTIFQADKVTGMHGINPTEAALEIGEKMLIPDELAWWLGY